MRRTSDFFKVVLVCAILFALFVAYFYVQIDAYNGDVSCLVVHCVKVIR